MTLQEIRRSYEQRNAPLLAEARAQVERLTDAIALGTRYSPRLTRIRAKLRWEIRNANAQELRAYLALWEPCFDHTCRAAERAETLAHFTTVLDEPEARPAHYTLGAAA